MENSKLGEVWASILILFFGESCEFKVKEVEGSGVGLKGEFGDLAPGKYTHLGGMGPSSHLPFQESRNLPMGHSRAHINICHLKKLIGTESVDMARTKSVQRGGGSFSDVSESNLVEEQGPGVSWVPTQSHTYLIPIHLHALCLCRAWQLAE